MMKKEFFKDFLDGVVIFLLVKGGIFEWVFYNGNMSGFFFIKGNIMVFIMKVIYFLVLWDLLYLKVWIIK